MYHHVKYKVLILEMVSYFINRAGGGPRVVVSTAAFHARVRGSVPGPFTPEFGVRFRDREVACSASDSQG